jgi:hypothetical protein
MFYFSAGCQVQSTIFSKETTPKWGEPSNGLMLSVSFQNRRLKIGDPALALVIIKNVSGNALSIQTIPAFTVEYQYWCPVDILNGGSNLPANTQVIISMEKDSSIKERIDISTLHCDEATSSRWPEHPFFEAIPKGRYVLRLEMETMGMYENNWIYSNGVEIEITA